MKFSVIIPTYNRSKFLTDTINSVLNQTIEDLEVIVCDDGSTDNSKQVVEKIAKLDKRVRWLPGKHAGRPAPARNRGIKEAKGEWIAFLDDDDTWISDKLEKQLQYAENNNYSFVCTNGFRKIGDDIKDNLLKVDEKSFNFETLIKTNYVINSSVIVKKSLLEKVSLVPESKYMKAVEDYGLWLRIALKEKIGYLNEPLVVYNDDAANSIRGVYRNNELKNLENKYKVYRNVILWMIRKKYISLKLLIIFRNFIYLLSFRIPRAVIYKLVGQTFLQ